MGDVEPTATNSNQLRPTATNCDQLRPTATNSNQCTIPLLYNWIDFALSSSGTGICFASFPTRSRWARGVSFGVSVRIRGERLPIL